MAQTTIDRLIINSPYAEPTRHWRYEHDLIEAYRGTASLPFEPGEHRRIESLKVVEVDT